MGSAVAIGPVGGPRARGPVRAGRVIAAAAVLTAVAAIPVARFLTAGSSRTADAPPRAVSAPDRLAALQQQVTTAPDDGVAWRSLAEVATQQAVRTGDPALYDLARRSTEAATRLLPGDERALVISGVLALSLHDFSRAHELGAAAVTASPTDPEALGVLVDASVELGRYDEAATTLQSMLDRRPDSRALARASYLRELHGDLPGAVLAMQQAVSAAQGDPADTAAVTELLGGLQLAEGDLAAAATSFERTLALTPERVGAGLGLARVRAAMGDLPGAIALAGSTAERSPQPAAAILLGELHLAAGDRGAADDAFALVRANEQLLAAAGVRTDLESAIFEGDHGDPARAVELARAAYGERRTVFTADALGWALTRSGQPAAALAFVDEALALDTANAAMRVHAAAALQAVGRADDAAVELRAAFAQSAWTAPAARTAAVQMAELLDLPVPGSWAL